MKLTGLLVIIWACMLAHTVLMYRAHAHFPAGWIVATFAVALITVVRAAFSVRQFLQVRRQYLQVRQRAH